MTTWVEAAMLAAFRAPEEIEDLVFLFIFDSYSFIYHCDVKLELTVCSISNVFEKDEDRSAALELVGICEDVQNHLLKSPLIEHCPLMTVRYRIFEFNLHVPSAPLMPID